MQLQEIKKAHFIGVRGIGVSAILRLLSLRGVVLTGSDSARLDEAMLPAGKYHEGHDEDNVESDTSIVIFSPAVPVTNVERMRAQELGIPQFSYPDALALVTSNKRTIAVSGTHGKSTTTALLGKFFESGGYDPSVIVGAEVSGWNHNYRHGDGEVFVVEACEYRRHMMSLSPGVILLTNLELDHPDYYSDLADVMQAFRAYIEKLPTNGKLIYNIDDANLRDITKKIDVETISFGISTAADLCAINILTTSDTQSFTLVWRGAVLGMLYQKKKRSMLHTVLELPILL